MQTSIMTVRTEGFTSPGRTTDRYLVSVEGWRLLVWRAIREDQEGKNYRQTVQVNPERDRRKYAPFIRMEYVN